MPTKPLTHYIWPPISDGDYLDTARRRCLNVMCLCAGFVGLFSGFYNYAASFTAYPIQTLIAIGGPLVVLSCPLIAASTKNVRAVALFFLGVTFVSMVAIPVIAGGLFSRANFFFLPWAVMATLFLGWRAGVGAAAIVFGVYTLFYVMRGYIAPSVYEVSPETISGWLYLALSLTLLTLIPGAAIFQREMEQAARRLAAARTEAEAANKAKSDFLARMSHEIRTPMNGILGMAELLQSSRLDAQQNVFVETISASSETLLTVINDILDLSKIEAGQLSFVNEPFALSSLLNQVSAMFAPRFAKKGVDFSVLSDKDDEHVVVGDQARIRQILINLVGNGLKFTEFGGVTLTLEATRVGDAVTLAFAIEDTGVGIPSGKIDAIFDNFNQAEDTTTRRFGGAGLGLAISRQLARSMGGDISVSSIYREGSTFIFRITLPIAAKAADILDEDLSFDVEFDDDYLIAEEEEAAGIVQIPAPEERLKVLVAEDNEVNQLVIRHMIDQRYYDAEFADNGVAALEAVKRRAFDVIFMDVSMPVMDGYDATSAIRRHEAEHSLRRTPIICLTAHALKGQRETSVAAGMDDFLAKPVRRAQVEEMLGKWGRRDGVDRQNVA